MERPACEAGRYSSALIAAANPAHRSIIALDCDGPAPLAIAHLALAESAVIVLAIARAIRLANLDADARYSDSDALSDRRRRRVESDRGRGAQQDQQFCHVSSPFHLLGEQMERSKGSPGKNSIPR